MIRILLLPILLLSIYRILHWIRNYISARHYGVPIILLPVSFLETWWVPLRPLFKWVTRLPFGLGHWYLYTNMGWPTEDGNTSLLRYGENFVLCSPVGNALVTSEAAVVGTVFGGKIIGGEEGGREIFAFYGNNVSSTTGEEWKRHRKIIMAAFNEKTNARCWKESDSQAQALGLGLDGEHDLAELRGILDVLAMRVLAIVVFGQDTDPSVVPPGHRQSLLQSLGFIMQNIMLTILFNSLKAPDIVLPKILRNLKVSVNEFRLYMQESVLHHLQHSTKSTSTRPTSLLESMIAANEASKQDTGIRRVHLSDSELYGNLFVFNLAGYETTSGTLTFAFPYLATHPNVQTWVTEEIDKHYRDTSEETPDYFDTYHKLVRCQAVMYETLRLAAHPPMLSRASASPHTLTLNGTHSVILPPNTHVGCNFYGAHLSPRWGEDVLEFNPRRFIEVSEAGEESLEVPAGVLYVPWSVGPRLCPAKKFSQVEFVSVLARVLSEWRVEGDKARLMGVLEGKYFNVSTHLKRPKEGHVRFVRR
jgi:cytochrome P450